MKRIGLGTLGLSLIGTFPLRGDNEGAGRHSLPRSTPEQQGVSSRGLSNFFDQVAKSKIEFHSVMVVRHGHVVAEGWWSPYAPNLKHTLYSLSKSLTSTAVGLAIHEGRFDLDSCLLSFFIDDKPKEITPFLAAMKIRHLLTMSTGHVKDTIQPMRHSSETWAKTFLSQPVEKEPGTFFLYNTGATYMLSAIIQKVTGETLHEYLKPRLFEPLGITGEDWETDPLGINTGGYGLRLKTEDIAKFGQLYLQKGNWNGKQIVPSKWVEEATRSQILSNSSNPNRPKDEDDWAQGYGYQFWRCRPGGYRADGAFGQFSIVMPEYDAVIAITSESFSMQNSMDLVWTYLLPAMDKKSTTLPVDAKSQANLEARLKGLRLDAPKLKDSSPVVSRISGKECVLETNEFKAKTIQLSFSVDLCIFTVIDEDGKHEIHCGINKWIIQDNKGKGTPFPRSSGMDVPTAIAGSATWLADNTLLMTWRLIESAHSNGLTFIFKEDKVTVKFHSSISQNNPKSVEKRSDLRGSYAT